MKNMTLQNLNHLHIEDLKNKQHPSVYFDSEAYEILILRFFNAIEENINVFSSGFVIDDENRVYLFNRDTQDISELTHTEFYILIDKKVDDASDYLNTLVEKVEDMEESIYDDQDIIKSWFELKKLFTRIDRILTQTTKIQELFFHKSPLKQDEVLKIGFDDINEHLNRATRVCHTNSSKLDNIYSLHHALTNEKLNSVIYTLTVISAIFLPLNLVVGFFGINTEGLFFSGNPDGTKIVTAILISIFTISALFFMKRKWL